MNKSNYCIFIDTLCEGRVPSVRGDDDLPFIFETRVEAERDIADVMIIRLQEFMDGERDFDDAASTEEYIVEVTVLPDGSVVDEDGKRFGSRRPKAQSQPESKRRAKSKSRGKQNDG